MTIKETRLFIEACDIADKVPLISGKHGLGKSDIVRQYSKDASLHNETLILSLMDTGDLLGIPRTTEVGGQLATVWAAPSWFNRIIEAAWPTKITTDDLEFKDENFKKIALKQLKTTTTREELNTIYAFYINDTSGSLLLHTQNLVTYKHSKRSVLFLDELNRAPVDILNASLQLILDKRLNDHVLPIVNGKPTLIVAAVNPDGEDYTVNSFDPALLDRFITGTVEPDAKAWLEDFARPKDISQVVRDFIAEHPDRIHYTPADSTTGATPRSWTSLATIVDKLDKIPNEIHFQLFKGCVGTEIASQFLAYYNNYSKVVKIEDLEALIDKKSKRSKNPETIAKHVHKLIAKQEAIQKTELANAFFDKYISKEEHKDMLPLLSYLYALDLEILNGFLKSKKESDTTNYMTLAAADGTLNNKGLFKKITTKIK